LIHLNSSAITRVPSVNAAAIHVLPEVMVDSIIASESHEGPFYNAWSIAVIIYANVALFLLITLMWRMVKLVLKIRNEKHYRYGRCKIIESAENNPAFSFFHFIYIGNARILTAPEKQQIIAHESVHVTQLHSLDNLLLQVTGIVFWFNPFINTYKKIFVQLHEFEADARTATGTEVNAYCSLLAKVALRSVEFPFANHFNQSLTLKRIDMIRTIKKRTRAWKFAAAAMVAVCCFLFIACQDQITANRPALASADLAVSAIPEGGMEAFYTYLKRNLRYPPEARQKLAQGKVLLEFVVKQDGTLSDVNLLASPDPALGEEAKRLLYAGPKWAPGKQSSGEIADQRLVLPFLFKLDGAKNTNAVTQTPDGALKEIVAVGYPPAETN
jgi:TonB family protein